MNARRLHFCRTCDRETAQIYVGSENGSRPPVEYFRCRVCGLVLMTMADVPDVEGLCLYVVSRFRSRPLTASLLEDAVQELRKVAWEAYLTWDPARAAGRRPDGGVTFRAYATTKLWQGIINWDRDHRGRVDQGRDPKPHSIADSLDESRGGRGGSGRRTLGEALSERADDREASSLAAFNGVVEARSGEIAREERKLGLRAASGA